ncbi:MAG TPA: protocatechuate 3,4-dioxygenase [Chloroflexota bacterium]|nr:protocatechuate 3,4-dioxygenase [Chloroflexota bacterium]
MRFPVSAALLSFTLALASLPEAHADTCAPTPRQTEGPYYPPPAQREAQVDMDTDLTHIEGQSGHAKGQVIEVTGQVRDRQCRPVVGAVVELWQASENGRYDHPGDRDNPAPLDPNFQYWAKTTTNQDGRYRFTTIKPGAYQAGPRWIRPPHLHFKVSHPAFGTFITQMYFAGDRDQDEDRILQDVPSHARDRVIMTPEPSSRTGVQQVRFDVTLP